MIKIVKKSNYKKIVDELENLRICNEELAKVNGIRKTENDNLKLQFDKSEKENNSLREELKQANCSIEKLEVDNASLRDIQLINETEINEKNRQIEDFSNKKPKTIVKLEKELSKIREENIKLGTAKGRLTKENNKLKAKLDAKDRVIEEYEKALYQAEEKNQNQLNTIKELTKKIEHKSIEYKNNGLSKQTKKAFKKGNK